MVIFSFLINLKHDYFISRRSLGFLQIFLVLLLVLRSWPFWWLAISSTKEKESMHCSKHYLFSDGFSSKEKGFCQRKDYPKCTIPSSKKKNVFYLQSQSKNHKRSPIFYRWLIRLVSIVLQILDITINGCKGKWRHKCLNLINWSKEIQHIVP